MLFSDKENVQSETNINRFLVFFPRVDSLEHEIEALPLFLNVYVPI